MLNAAVKFVLTPPSRLYALHITKEMIRAKKIGPSKPIAYVNGGENLAPPSICCCFCSADICAARGLFSICWLMNSRQLIRWLIEKLTAMLSIVISASGSTQLGFLTMSSKVFSGEKKTPITRPNGLIKACASGAGTAVVAIEDSSTTRLRGSAFCQGLRTSTGEYFSGGILAHRKRI